MPRKWLNDRQPDENGDYILVIENAAGARVSTFKGKTMEEVADKLAESQEEANRTISTLRKPDAGRPSFRVQPKELTAADRLRLSSEITDPSRVVEAVEEIVTAKQGVAPDRLGAKFAEMSQADQDHFYETEAAAFKFEHPDYYPVPQNRDALFAELMKNKWDLTRNNLAIAYETLKERGEMVFPPDEETDEFEDEEETQTTQPRQTSGNGYSNGKTTATATQAAPSPRPRSISTGLRNADVSATPPAPPKKKKYTRADIEMMSRAEFNDKLRADPEFRRQVDAM